MLLLTRQSMRFYQSKFVVINKGRRGVRRYYYTYSLCYQQGTEGGGEVCTTWVMLLLHLFVVLSAKGGGCTTCVVLLLHLFVVLSARDGGGYDLGGFSTTLIRCVISKGRGGGGVYDVGDVITTLIRCVISKGQREGGTTWVVSLLHLFVVLSARDGMFKIASINLQLYFTKIYVNRNHIAFKAFTLL